MSIIIETINNRLDCLAQAKEYGVEPAKYNLLKKSVREKFNLISKPIEFSAAIWNKVLLSEKMIQYFNERTLEEADLKVVRKVLNLGRPLEDLEDMFTLGLVTNENLFPYEVEYLDLVNRRNHWLNQSTLDDFELTTFIDALHYARQHGLEWNETFLSKFTNVLGSIVNESKTVTQYCSFSLAKRLEFLHYRLTYRYSNELGSPLQHFESAKAYFDLFEDLFEKTILVNDIQWTRGLFLGTIDNIMHFVNISQNPERARTWIDEILKHDNGAKWIRTIVANKSDAHDIYEFEVRKLAEAAYDDTRPIYEIIYGKDSDMQKLLDCVVHNDAIIYKQIRKWHKEKKKAILRLFASNPNKYMAISRYSIIFFDHFQNAVNVNTLNEDDVKKLMMLQDSTTLNKHIRNDIRLTFNEFEYLFYEQDEINREVYYQLVHNQLPIDERLRKAKELPKLKEFTEFMGKELLVDQIALLLTQHSISSWMKHHPLENVHGVTTEQKLFTLMFPTIFQKFQNDIRFASDIEFMMKNFRLLHAVDSLNAAKGLFIKENKEALKLFEHLGLSETFIETYRDNIIYFLDRNLGHVYLTLAETLENEQENNLRLITKAELANKLEEIKFVDDDFELEIGLPLTEIQKANWKENQVLNVPKLKGYSVTETYDYETTIRIGEAPVQSCLHWNRGQYNRCLLSLFDTNKKMLVAKDEKGRIHARAALRLIKGSTDDRVYSLVNEKTFTNKALVFKDIENTTNSAVVAGNKEDVQENLVLFLENIYTSLNYDDDVKVRKAFIKLAEQKAAELGATLIMSTYYKNNVSDEYVNHAYHVFISYSKNGYQYLDSLTGQASESLEGSYRTTHVLINHAAVEEEALVS